MSERESLINKLLETKDNSELVEHIIRLEEKIALIMSLIVVQQKDACEVAGVTPVTVRNKVLRGEIDILQRDGSRMNYLTLGEVGELKTRKRTKKSR